MDEREIRKLRDGLGMSQVEFAAFIGVAQNTVWRWENGWAVSAPWPELIRMKCTAARQRDRQAAATA